MLDLPDALEPLMLEELQRAGYDYRLYTVIDGEEIAIAESVGYQGADSIIKEIKVPNHIWQLALSPKRSWTDRLGLALILVFGFGFTALCAIIVHMLEAHHEQLKQYADFDALTGLVNRRNLLSFLNLRCRDEKAPMALLYIDINDFKKINDTYGHSEGDALLREAAHRMKVAIANEDVVARMGGDEFVAVLEHCDTMERCQKQMESISEALGRPVKLKATTIQVGASIGYALYPSEAVGLQGLLDLADQRMYEEKRRKKQ